MPEQGEKRRQARRRTSLRAWAAFVLALAFLVRLPFLFGISPQHGTANIYVTLAARLTHGEGVGGFHFFPPGYPLFVALLQQLPGRTEDAVGVAQHLLGIALALGILAAGWRWFGRPTAVLAATLAALSPLMVWTEQMVLPDLLFAVVVFGGAAALAEAARRHPDGIRWLVLTGLLFGVAAWIKPAGQFLLVAAPLALAIATRDFRAVLRGSAIVCGVLVLVISPWLVRNAVGYHFLGMANQGNQTLFNRAFERDGLEIPKDVRYGRLARQVQAERPHSRLTYSFEGALRARGLGFDEIYDIQGQLATTAIRRHPAGYGKETWNALVDIARYVRPAGEFGLVGERDRIDPPIPRVLTTGLWRAADVLGNLWWLLSLNTLAGLLVLWLGDPRARAAGAALLSAWFVVALGTAITHGGNARYGIHLAPLAWLLGSAGAVMVADALRDRLSGRSPSL